MQRYRSGHNGADSKSCDILPNHPNNFIWKRIEVVVTSRTRNAVVRKGTWVRIPPLPPEKPQKRLFLGLFSILFTGRCRGVARCRNLCPRSWPVSGPENVVCCLNCCPVVLKQGKNEWELIKNYGEFGSGFSETSAGNSTVSWYSFSTTCLRSQRTST